MNKLFEDAIEGCRTLRDAEKYLADRGVLTCGIESITFKGSKLLYLNRGDTYDITLCRERNAIGEYGPIFAADWGTWLEEKESEYCQEEDQIRCGYCGEFTDNDQESWRAVVCTSCNHNVEG